MSPRKSLTVILLKLLVTLAVYGPVTNGCVFGWMRRRVHACLDMTLSIKTCETRDLPGQRLLHPPPPTYRPNIHNNNNSAFLAAVPVLEKGLKGFDISVWLHQLREITIRDVQLWSLFYPVNFTRTCYVVQHMCR